MVNSHRSTVTDSLIPRDTRNLIPSRLADLIDAFAEISPDVRELWSSDDFDTTFAEWEATCPDFFRECRSMSHDFAVFCQARGVTARQVRIDSMHPYTGEHYFTRVYIPGGHGVPVEYNVCFTGKQYGNLPAISNPAPADGEKYTADNDFGPGPQTIPCPLIWKGQHPYGYPLFESPEFTLDLT